MTEAARPLSLSQSRREANERITARISSDHGLTRHTGEDKAKRRKKGDRMAVGE